jgi:hypothetical protein
MYNSIELPRYQCHKIVHALKIKALQPHPEHPGEYLLTPEDSTYAPFMVSRDYVNGRSAKGGGYYVTHEDGYESFSPAEAFESGYTRIQEPIGNQPFPGEDAITDAINEATMNRNSLC